MHAGSQGGEVQLFCALERWRTAATSEATGELKEAAALETLIRGADLLYSDHTGKTIQLH